MAQCPIGDCNQLTKIIAENEAKREEVAHVRNDIIRIYDKIEDNTKWLIGLLFTIGVETVALIVTVIQVMQK